jgi:hypothetical protein
LRTLRPVRRVFYGLWQKQGTSPQYDIKETTMISQIFNPATLKLLRKFGELTEAPLAAKLANSTCTSDQVVTAGQKSVTRSVLSSSLAACFFVALAAPPVMAEATSGSAANQCLTDLRAFNSQMQKDGYWLGGYGGAADPALGGYGYGYGYPLDGSGYGAGVNDSQGDAGASYLNARPGYEIRSLLAAADILARHEQIQPCEGVLAATRDQYKQYVADMGKAGMKMTNVPGWQLQQIAAAQPVASTTSAFRSDQLLGTDVRNPQNEALGSIDDVASADWQDRLSVGSPGRVAFRDWRTLRCGALGCLQSCPERDPTRPQRHQKRHGCRPSGEPPRLYGHGPAQSGSGCLLEGTCRKSSQQLNKRECGANSPSPPASTSCAAPGISGQSRPGVRSDTR